MNIDPKLIWMVRKFVFMWTRRAWNLGCSTTIFVTGTTMVLFSLSMMYRAFMAIRLSDAQLLREAQAMIADGFAGSNSFPLTAHGLRDLSIFEFAAFGVLLAAGVWVLGEWGTRLHWYHSVPCEIAERNAAVYADAG